MGKYLRTIQRMVKGLEVKSGEILLFGRQQVYSKEKKIKFHVLTLQVARKKARKIITAYSEPQFMEQAAALLQMDRRELIDVLLERKERGE